MYEARGRAWTAVRALVALAAGLAAGAQARAASLSIETGAIVLGRTESATVTVRVDEPPGAEDRPLRLAVNVGSFSEPRRLSAGKYRATYVPPQTRFPQVALVAVWRETGPDARIDFLRMPLFGQTRLPVSVRGSSEVTVQVGFDQVGPVKADAHGKALIPIVVPPDVAEAAVSTRDRNGATATKKVAIEVPPYNRLTAALVPHTLVADGKSHARLDVYYDLGGARIAAGRVRVAPSAGTVTMESAGRGLYVYRYVPPAGSRAQGVDFRIDVEGDPHAHATARLALGAPAPARLLVRPPPAPLVAGSGASSTVEILVLDAEGLGVPEQRVELAANGLPLRAAEERGQGLYVVPFPAPAAYPPGGLVRLEARLAGGALSALANWQLQPPPAPRSVVARLSPSPVPADGRSEAILELDVRDAGGMPLENAQLMVSASDGTIGPLSSRGRGRYRAAYLPPEALPDGEAGVKVVDATGTFDRSFPLPLRAPAGGLLVGVRGGWVHSLGDLSAPRLGIDASLPFRVGGAWLAAGVAATYGSARQSISDAASGLTVSSEAAFVPVSLRLTLDVWAGRRASLAVGAGALATFARFTNSGAPGADAASALGAQAISALAFSAGRGQAFLEASYSRATVETDRARLPAGGLGVEAGYRVRVY